jgi:UDP-glucose 4-epimerase
LKKVLITGACGYLGARLSKDLSEKGFGITAFDSYDPSTHNQWTSLMDEVIVGDIRDESTISDLADKNFDVVIHLISLDHHKSENEPNFVSSINVMPTWNLLDKLTQKGLKKFIYFSTIHVYGKIPKEIITEDQQPAPLNPYGLTHLLSENICNYYNNKTDTECINVRLSNSYGSPVFKENNCWWLVINDLCKTAYKEKKIKLLSDGSSQRDFIHSSDVCRVIEFILNTDKNNMQNNTYHISSGNTLTIWELAQTVKKVYQDRFKLEIPVILPENTISMFPDKFLRAEKYIVSNTKIKSLGFATITELKTGINELFDYLEKSYEF